MNCKGFGSRIGDYAGADLRDGPHYGAMGGWQGSAIAVAGTLAGATLACLFQRANALRLESFGRAERLRQERIAAYGAFVGAVTGLRQGVVTL